MILTKKNKETRDPIIYSETIEERIKPKIPFQNQKVFVTLILAMILLDGMLYQGLVHENRIQGTFAIGLIFSMVFANNVAVPLVVYNIKGKWCKEGNVHPVFVILPLAFLVTLLCAFGWSLINQVDFASVEPEEAISFNPYGTGFTSGDEKTLSGQILLSLITFASASLSALLTWTSFCPLTISMNRSARSIYSSKQKVIALLAQLEKYESESHEDFFARIREEEEERFIQKKLELANTELLMKALFRHKLSLILADTESALTLSDDELTSSVASKIGATISQTQDIQQLTITSDVQDERRTA